MTAPRSAYLHVPFCRHHCGYCNFTVIAGRDELLTPYLDAIERELSWLQGPHPLETLFLGGGTPSYLTGDYLARLLELIMQGFQLVPGYEWTIEANPEDVNEQVAAALASAGVTRVSLGVQSFEPDKLQRLERSHDAAQVRRAADAVQARGLQLSLDLIFGVPGEALSTWEQDLAQAIAIHPDHLSTYGLTFERGTRFYSRLIHGQLAQVDEETDRSMYELALAQLQAAGFEHYEVSNFARPGHRCRHNEVYWLGGEYFGVGPGAAGYREGRRFTNHRSVTTYLRRVLANESPVAESETLSEEERARERLVFGLRRLEGVHRDTFETTTGFQLDALGGDALRQFVEQGLLEDTGSHIRLTRAGLLISDAMWPALI